MAQQTPKSFVNLEHIDSDSDKGESSNDNEDASAENKQLSSLRKNIEYIFDVVKEKLTSPEHVHCVEDTREIVDMFYNKFNFISDNDDDFDLSESCLDIDECDAKVEFLVRHHNTFVTKLNQLIKVQQRYFEPEDRWNEAMIREKYEAWFQDELLKHFQDKFIPTCECDCLVQSWEPNTGVEPWEMYSTTWNPQETTGVLMREIYLPDGDTKWTCQCEKFSCDESSEMWEENSKELEKLGYYWNDGNICTEKVKGTGFTFPGDDSFHLIPIEFPNNKKRKQTGASMPPKKR